MPEGLSSAAQWAQISRLEAKDRAVLTKDKYRFVAFCIEDAAVDIQLIADELQLSKTAVVSRLVTLAAREVCVSLDLDRPALQRPDLDDINEEVEMLEYEPSAREVARRQLLRSKDGDAEEVAE